MSRGPEHEVRPILITGGGGALARALSVCEWPATYKILASTRQALDICDTTQVHAAIAATSPAVIINTAAYTKVDLAESAASSALGVNDRGCAVLGAAAARLGVKLLHVSTDFVFSGALGRPYLETDTPDPLNAYGRSKLRGEGHILASGRDAVVVRASWLLSGRAGFIPAIVERIQQGEAFQVVDDQLGTPTDIDDLAGALRDIAVRMAGGGATQRIYHVAGTGEATWHEIAVAAAAAWSEHTGKEAPAIRPITSGDWGAPANRPLDSRLDSSAFLKDFGYSLPSWRVRLARWVAAYERRRA